MYRRIVACVVAALAFLVAASAVAQSGDEQQRGGIIPRKHLVRERTETVLVGTSDVQLTGCHPTQGAEHVVAAIARRKASFIFIAGDFTENKPPHDAVCIAAGWNNDAWTGPADFGLFERTWTSLIRMVGQRNVYGTPGNHDVWASADVWVWDPKQKNYVVSYDEHGDYAFLRDGIFFLMLNVTAPRDSRVPSWDTVWAGRVLASDEAQEADFRIAVFHEPGTTNRSAGWNNSLMAMTIREQLHPLFDRYGVEWVINGHIHTYRSWFEGARLHTISGGSGGGFQGDTGDVVSEWNFRHFLEVRKVSDNTTPMRLEVTVVGVDETDPQTPVEYRIDSFRLVSTRHLPE
jgi:hypothetical protein